MITGSQHYNGTDMHMMKTHIYRSHTFRKVQPLDIDAVKCIYTHSHWLYATHARTHRLDRLSPKPTAHLLWYLPSHPVHCSCSRSNADAVENEHQQDGEGEVGVDQVGVVTEQVLATQQVKKRR